jgi:hypothetical protein
VLIPSLAKTVARSHIRSWHTSYTEDVNNASDLKKRRLDLEREKSGRNVSLFWTASRRSFLLFQLEAAGFARWRLLRSTWFMISRPRRTPQIYCNVNMDLYTRTRRTKIKAKVCKYVRRVLSKWARWLVDGRDLQVRSRGGVKVERIRFPIVSRPGDRDIDLAVSWHEGANETTP